MGGCASKPKELDINENAPAPVEAAAVEYVESETVAQDINGGEETNTGKPLADFSEPIEETNETIESKQDQEISKVPETKANEQVDVEEMIEDETVVEPKLEAVAVAEAEVEPESEAAPAEENVVSETETSPELVQELKAVEGETSEDKSDSPLITM
ncbi:uncharacterized protein LOC130814020 [Amaranthus tricolor]|uniref:uncharacterized protein LOC130814020 n=1 Tax=Amaranthus tricolor TaxID=29722 RepID=UPI002590FFE8|nr:uncharacterized protein LOC130814020 [Amaranthus tricolor]